MPHGVPLAGPPGGVTLVVILVALSNACAGGSPSGPSSARDQVTVSTAAPARCRALLLGSSVTEPRNLSRLAASVGLVSFISTRLEPMTFEQPLGDRSREWGRHDCRDCVRLEGDRHPRPRSGTAPCWTGPCSPPATQRRSASRHRDPRDMRRAELVSTRRHGTRERTARPAPQPLTGRAAPAQSRRDVARVGARPAPLFRQRGRVADDLLRSSHIPIPQIVGPDC
jgi:hypothetical protein